MVSNLHLQNKMFFTSDATNQLSYRTDAPLYFMQKAAK
jgi:hypothetical protein